MTRTLHFLLAAVMLSLGVALRWLLVLFHLVNGSIEIFLPLTYIGLGLGLLLVKHRLALTLITTMALMAIGFVGLLVAIGGAAPFAR